MAQRRAAFDGEIGANGEAYPAGAFIATTDHAKGKVRQKRKGPRNMEVGPFEWAVQPVDGAEPIYTSAIGGVFGGRYPTSSVTDQVLAYLQWTREELESRVRRWQAGERWM